MTEEDLLHPLEGDRISQGMPHLTDLAKLFNVIDAAVRRRGSGHVLGDHRVDWNHATIRPHSVDIVVFDRKPVWDQNRFETCPAGKLDVRPLLVIEITSLSTRTNDLIHKREHYRILGVPFYLIVDVLAGPNQDQCELLAYRLVAGDWQNVPADEWGLVGLPDLDIKVGIRGRVVDCYNTVGERYPTHVELLRQFHEAQAARREANRLRNEAIESVRKATEEAQARAAEEHRMLGEQIARLQTELDALRAEQASGHIGSA